MINLRRLALLFSLSAVSCAENLPGENPEPGVFYFPIGIELSSSGRYAYVLNSNFDQRFNTGWISVVDLEAAVAQGGVVPSKTVVRSVVSDGDGNGGRDLYIPNLGGALELSADGTRLYASHRSDRLVTIIDVRTETELSCNSGEKTRLATKLRRTDCEREHLFEITYNDVEAASETDFDDLLARSEQLEAIELIADPYALREVRASIDGGAATPVLLVGHLADTSRALLTAISIDPGDISSTAIIRSDRVVNSALSIVDLISVPNADPPLIAAVGDAVSGGERRSLIAHVDINRWLQRLPRSTQRIVPGSVTGGEGLASFAFSPDGLRGFGSDRINARGTTVNPRGALLAFDTSMTTEETIDESGAPIRVSYPRYQVEGGTPLRGQPSAVVYLERPEGDLVATVDLDQDAVYFNDPSVPGVPVVGRIDVPGGPFSAIPAVVSGRTYLVCTSFFDHAVALIDVSGPSPTDFRLAAIVRDDGLEKGERAR